MSRSSLCSVVLLAGLTCSGVQADDLPGSQDLAQVSRFPGAEIVDYREGPERERVYPLGPVQRISNQLRMEGQLNVGGQLTAVTYQLPEPTATAPAFTQARKALQANGAQLLFWCEGQNCGSSSLWANEIFGNARLYGPDPQQAALLARLPDSDTVLVIYSIIRGNRRAYLHVERLESGAPLGQLLPGPSTLLRELRDTGQLAIPAPAPDQDATPQGPWANRLGLALNLDAGLRVELAGPQAQAWRQALVSAGVRASRLQVNESAPAPLRVLALP